MNHTDHGHHPDAPPAARNVTITAVAFVQDARGRVLLTRTGDEDEWTLPHGVRGDGESLGHAINRALAHQTGIAAEAVNLVGIYRDPDQPADDPSSDRRERFSICVRARPPDREPTPTRNARWVTPDELDDLPIHESTRLRITHGLEHRTPPHVDASPLARKLAAARDWISGRTQ